MMLNDLLKYTAAADRKIMEVIQANPGCDDRVSGLFSHILNAQHIWISRIFNEVPVYDRMQIHSADRFPEIHEMNTAGLKRIIGTVPLQSKRHYSTSFGDVFENTVEEILYHVVNHSTYHRGQVASRLREQGIDPPVTDLIILKRSGEL